MGADRTALAVKYQPGDQVLVWHTTGKALEQPKRCMILRPAQRSRLYAYEVTWGSFGDQFIRVKEDWISPAETVIQEVPDTPWD